MKKRCILSIISLLLTLVLLLAQVTLLISCINENENTDSGNGNDATDDNPGNNDASDTSDNSDNSGNSGNENGENKPNDNENVTPGDESVLKKTTPLYAENVSDFETYDTQGKPVFNANFCKDFEKINIPPAEYALKKTVGDAPNSIVSFIWNSKSIRYTLNTDKADSISVNIGKYEEVFGTDALENGTTLTRTVSLDTIGVSIQDIGQLIETKITVKSGDLVSESDGYIQISDYKISFNTTGMDKSYFTRVNSTVKSSAAGIDFDNGKIRLFDTYSNGKGVSNTKLSLQKKDIIDLQTEKRNFVIEADLTIDAMPVYSPIILTNSSAAGLNFNVCHSSSSPSFLFTLVNTNNGIAVMVVSDGAYYLANTGKKVGDNFRFAASLSAANGSTIISIDGKVIATFTVSNAARKDFASKSVNIVWMADGNEKKSNSDNMDITINSVMVYYDQSRSATNSLTTNALFGGKAISPVDTSLSIYRVINSMSFVETAFGERYGLDTTMYWSSSNESIISKDGTLTAPKGNGKIVTVTFYTLDGNTVLGERAFNFFVPGENGTVLVKNSDTNPFTGVAKATDAIFTLNTQMNSIVYDMGNTTVINRATIKSLLPMGLISKNFVGLYYSNDNENYTRIDSFSMLQTGNDLYFYNFSIEARYLKVHMSFSGLENTGTIVNATGDLLVAEYSNAPLLSTGTFTKTVDIPLKNNTNETVYDKVFSLTLSDMGISAYDLKRDKSDIRFMHDGAYLPHFLVGSTFYVRVLEMAANENITVKVIYGNKNAESVSDGNETFEIQYGEKYAKINNERGWFNTIITAPNGDVLRIVSESGGFGVYRSTDGGLTWGSMKKIANSTVVTENTPGIPYGKPTCECGGSIVDKKNGKIFFICQRIDKETSPKIGLNYIFLSTDNGETWTLVGNPTGSRTETNPSVDNIDDKRGAPNYALSYSDGLTLSCADGTGPNVDYVFTLGECVNQATSAFNTTAFYSKDGGKSWIFSNSTINYENGSSNFFEGGCSEDALIEQANGTLIFYARCQIDGIDHFVMSKSTDHGVTWKKPTLTNIYTTNTQPIVERMGDGKPVLLWGGNNVLGGRSYMRFPLNLAYSNDDGETFEGIQNASFGTVIETYDTLEGRSLHTNPDLTFVTYKGTEITYIVSTKHQMYIIGVDDFLYKQKGAFDSFESGVAAEGWFTVSGSVASTPIGATDGSLAMAIGQNTTAVRSITYMEKGTVEFDYYIDSFGYGQVIELQAAYNNKEGATPISKVRAPIAFQITSKGEVKYINASGEAISTGLYLDIGNNTISISFDGNARSATITVNRDTANIGFSGNDIYVCYVTIFTKDYVKASLDRFMVIKDN
ncbi:MAG: DUF2341 domain-containing protein [Clostridia bacterium]|nr:DUF2341 domain-containing protein [Clostridia bacterium]